MNGAATVIALAGNPNVGKSTLFNALTGLRQHTGNWPGKTVGSAWGRARLGAEEILLVDTPGAYSLTAHSAEEEHARDAICFGGAHCVVVVCDANCLERNLHLVLQILEVTDRVVMCVNLLDEAKKNGVEVDLKALEAELGVPVRGCAAREGAGVEEVLRCACETAHGEVCPVRTRYPPDVEDACARIGAIPGLRAQPRFLALRLLCGDEDVCEAWTRHRGLDARAIEAAREVAARIDQTRAREESVAALYRRAQALADRCVKTQGVAAQRQERIDRLLTGRCVGTGVMLLLLLGVLYITIAGANYPAELLSRLFARLEALFAGALVAFRAPGWLTSLLAEGMLRVLGWVVAVMLPPMAIFFALFTLLEDLGYLPRVAFNLDRHFRRCHACGKQCLTMCLGFGCNAVGVTGCRIIDSPRERMIAILTNSFVPCNGRFALLIPLLTMFFSGAAAGSALPALMLAGLIVLGIAATLGVSRLLSATLLRGMASSFTLELPPFRRPRVGRVLARCFVERTLLILRRAVAVAAPAGIAIWLLANVEVSGATLLARIVASLDPFARFFGLDGAIFAAFILAAPAAEIMLPLVMMIYASGGTLVELSGTQVMHALLTANGWTALTALNTMLFCLMHWPCATTLFTIARETRSAKWTLLAAAIPTACGLAACALTNWGARLFLH